MQKETTALRPERDLGATSASARVLRKRKLMPRAQRRARGVVTIGDRDSAGPIRESRSLGSGGEETIRILIVIVPLPSRRRLQRTGGTWTDTWFMSSESES
jgi:hypothetical protein